MKHGRFIGIPDVVKQKPLQASKFLSILLTIVLGGAGFFRIINATAIVGDPRLGDGQLLAIILLPLISLGLVAVVFVETLVTGYRSLRSETSITEQIAGRLDYALLQGAEAACAVVGVILMLTAFPVLFAESTPAPAGVGIMLLLLVIGLGILTTSFIRTTVELFVYGSTPSESC